MNVDNIQARLERAAGADWTDEVLAEEAVELAAEILEAAQEERRIAERYQAWKMHRMLDDPHGKAFTLAMADQVFRPRTAWRAASQFRHLVTRYGAPEYLPLHERMGMVLAVAGSWIAPETVMEAVTTKMRMETRQVVLPAEERYLARHIARRRKMGARLNLNILGEAILGDQEAERRLQENLQQLASESCDYISVKISSIFSQVNVLAYDDTLERVKEPLRTLYRAALANQVDGRPKFVNLDMEEFRDLHLTCDAFKAVLDEEEFLELEAGIVLQAYLPDSYRRQQDLTEWALARCARGGAGIKLRLVKGANLAMERVEAAVHGWAQAPYDSKGQVDANFKRMLHHACLSEHAKAVRLGVGSHNLFDVAYALLLRERAGVADRVEIEMLEGMANYQARVVEEIAGTLLFYAPVVKRENFHSAIAYLVRRLDENTAPENFLHDLFGMHVGGPKWNEQAERFRMACAAKSTVKALSSRQQDRRSGSAEVTLPAFSNEPDTDWTREGNRLWIKDALGDVEIPEVVGLQVGGRVRAETANHALAHDPGAPERELYRYALAGSAEVEEALATAERAVRDGIEPDGFTLRELLVRAATALGQERGKLIATMVYDSGKAVPEADSEVSEAIDFANYYSYSTFQPGLADGVERSPLGVVVVAPPWNFPLAIACGGVLAALQAGNAVILKPPPETVLTAWRLAETLWAAGVPREVLQFVSVPEDEVGKQLLTDGRVAAVILTGAYETARLFKSWKPEMRLYAETSGKNAMLITAAADPDQAIKDLLKSAFGHAGQKCSAASLAIVEGEVYDDPVFMRQLKDAAASLRVGVPQDLASVVTPVIREPADALRRGLTTLEEGEEWLLEPQQHGLCLWSPGIKIGVRPDGWYRRTECFGPVLGIIRAQNFEEGLRIQNDSQFGLTGGLQSLDEREIRRWREEVEVGNAYINRPTTGAIVRRQPFGGWKRSVVGPGAKAGGPNYVLQLSRWREAGLPQEVGASRQAPLALEFGEILPGAVERITRASLSYAKWWKDEFGRDHDPSRILGESNVFRYRPRENVMVRCDGLCDEDLALILLAMQTCGVSGHCSATRDEGQRGALARAAGIDLWLESEEQFCARLDGGDLNRLRVLAPSDLLRRAAVEAEVEIIDWPVLSNGRIELLHYVREQAVTETVHRYGNVIRDPDSPGDPGGAARVW